MPSIYVHDSNQFGFLGLLYKGIIHDTSIEVVSVADMVTKVLKILESGNALNELIFGGDAGILYQSVGAKDLFDPTGDRSIQLDDNGELKGGGGRYLPLLKGRIKKVTFYHLNEESYFVNFMTAVGKALGTGTIVKTKNYYMLYKNDGEGKIRMDTHEATLDRAALKARLAQYTGK